MEIVTLYLQEQKCLIALITLKTLLLSPSPAVCVASVVLQVGLVGWRFSTVKRSENIHPGSVVLWRCFVQDSHLLPRTFALPLPRGSFINLPVLTLLLAVSFLQPLRCLWSGASATAAAGWRHQQCPSPGAPQTFPKLLQLAGQAEHGQTLWASYFC